MHVHGAATWVEDCESKLYEIDYRLWMHQKDTVDMRRAVQKLRSALPLSGAAYLHEHRSQTRSAYADQAIDGAHSYIQGRGSSESHGPDSAVIELMEGSPSETNETTPRLAQLWQSTACSTNATDTDIKPCEPADRAAHTETEQSERLMDVANRAGLASGSSKTQRVELRRSPRRHKQA
jgi:hypothetical protein